MKFGVINLVRLDVTNSGKDSNQQQFIVHADARDLPGCLQTGLQRLFGVCTSIAICYLAVYRFKIMCIPNSTNRVAIHLPRPYEVKGRGLNRTSPWKSWCIELLHGNNDHDPCFRAPKTHAVALG